MHVTHLDDHASPLAAFSALPFRHEEWQNLGLGVARLASNLGNGIIQQTPSLAPMAKEYKAPRVYNRLIEWMTHLGIGSSVVMVTTGRKSGEPRSVPVSPITVDGVEYIVAPYGSVGWVQNVRDDPHVTIEKGRGSRPARLVEVTSDSAGIVKQYYERESFSRQYMDVPQDPTVEDFERVSGSFPVFRVED